MKFAFELTGYDEESFISQVSKALEKRTESVSRNKYPRVWEYIDKMNSKGRVSEEVSKKRRRRYKVYGILFMLVGFFLLIPSLVKPEELLVPLLAGAFAIVIGMLYLWFGRKPIEKNMTSFDRAAMKLFDEYKKIPAEVTVTFTDDKVQLAGDAVFDYGDINKFYITKDFLIIIWKERITILQKKDLSSCSAEEFINFITYKSQNLFDVLDIR